LIPEKNINFKGGIK